MDIELANSFRAIDNQIGDIRRIVTESKQSIIGLHRGDRRPPSPRTLLIRAIAIKALGEIHNLADDEIIRQRYRDAANLKAIVRDIGGWHRKAATDPARTDVPDWAQELVDDADVYSGMLPSLAPASVYSRLAALGLSLTRSAAAGIRLPYPIAPGAVPPIWTGEAEPIPVTSFNFAGGVIAPHKAAVLAAYTSEMATRSTPDFESVLRQLLNDQTAIALDTGLLDANAASAIRPAGLLYGIPPLAASSATDPAIAAYEDIRMLFGAFDPPPSSPVLVMAAPSAIALSMLYPDLAVPVLVTATMPTGRVVALDGADFASLSDGDGEIRADQSALIEMANDPSPDIMTQAPLSSMWQADMRNIRLLETLGFAMRRPGRVQWLEGAAW